MSKNFNNFSSWRTDIIELEPNGVTDFPFFDTKPNLIYIKNPNNTHLYFGMKNVPNPDKYEFEIKPRSYDTFGQPNGTGHLYIYNPSTDRIAIECYSIFDEFNIAILKNYSLAVDKMKVDGEFTFKEGVSLPSGSNEIGSVSISQNGLNALSSIILGSSYTTDILIDILNKLGGTQGEQIEILLAGIKTAVQNLSISGIEPDLSSVESLITLCKNSLLVTEANTGNIASCKDSLTGIKNDTANLENILTKLTELYNRVVSDTDTSDITTKTVTASGTESTTITIGTGESSEFKENLCVINDGKSKVKITFLNASSNETGSLLINPGEVFDEINISDGYTLQVTAVTNGEAYNCRIIGK